MFASHSIGSSNARPQTTRQPILSPSSFRGGPPPPISCCARRFPEFNIKSGGHTPRKDTNFYEKLQLRIVSHTYLKQLDMYMKIFACFLVWFVVSVFLLPQSNFANLRGVDILVRTVFLSLRQPYFVHRKWAKMSPYASWFTFVTSTYILANQSSQLFKVTSKLWILRIISRYVLFE